MMYGKSLALWCCMLLFIASFSVFWSNFTSDDKEKDYSIVRYRFDASAIRNYDDEDNLYENSTKGYNDMHYVYSINFMNNNRKGNDLIRYNFQTYSEKNHKNDSQMPMEPRTNVTEIAGKKDFISRRNRRNLQEMESKNDSMSHDFSKNFNKDNNKNNVIPYKICDNITCIPLCCPFGKWLINGKCITGDDNFLFLGNMYGYINDSLQNEDKTENLFLLVVHDPCQKYGYYLINPYLMQNIFRINGSLYIPHYNAIIEPTSYCLANVDKKTFAVSICVEIMQELMKKVDDYTYFIYIQKVTFNTTTIVLICTHVWAILTSLIMFIVYCMPELRTVHGFILCNYSGLLFIGYTSELVNILIPMYAMSYSICIVTVFVKYFCFVGSYLWLNIMCFDMWRAFRQLLQRNVKQQERKKYIMYSAYGWGGPFMLSAICGIIDFTPALKNLIRPGFASYNCWFSSSTANWLYYYDIIIISIIASICLSICTARNIAHYEKDITRQLKGSESRRYNDNKQWFKLTVKLTKILFIILCFKSYLYTIHALYNEQSFSAWYTFITLDIIQNFCIVIIFVWKKKIKELLLKQFRCQNRRTG